MVLAVNVQDLLKKKLAIVAAPTANQNTQVNAPAAQQGAIEGLSFKGQGDETKAQNTALFNSLDENAKDIIKSEFVEKSWGGFGDMDKIAEKLEAAGYQAKVGQGDEVNKEGGAKGQHVKYLEITDKNGKTVRLWDANGDGGFGTADLNVNGALKDFKNTVNETKNVATEATAAAPAAPAPVANPIAPQVANQEQKADVVDMSEAKKLLRARLEALGYSEEEIEPKINSLLTGSNEIEKHKVLNLI